MIIGGVTASATRAGREPVVRRRDIFRARTLTAGGLSSAGGAIPAATPGVSWIAVGAAGGDAVAAAAARIARVAVRTTRAGGWRIAPAALTRSTRIARVHVGATGAVPAASYGIGGISVGASLSRPCAAAREGGCRRATSHGGQERTPIELTRFPHHPCLPLPLRLRHWCRAGVRETLRRLFNWWRRNLPVRHRWQAESAAITVARIPGESLRPGDLGFARDRVPKRPPRFSTRADVLSFTGAAVGNIGARP